MMYYDVHFSFYIMKWLHCFVFKPSKTLLVKNTYHLLTESEVITGKSQTEALWGQYTKAKVWDFAAMTKQTRLTSYLLYGGLFGAILKKEYCRTLSIWSPTGPKNLTVLTTVFYKKMYSCFARWPKKVAVIMRWLYYRGCSKAGFHCTIKKSCCCCGSVHRLC